MIFANFGGKFLTPKQGEKVGKFLTPKQGEKVKSIHRFTNEDQFLNVLSTSIFLDFCPTKTIGLQYKKIICNDPTDKNQRIEVERICRP
jgi:hypothetical protein